MQIKVDPGRGILEPNLSDRRIEAPMWRSCSLSSGTKYELGGAGVLLRLDEQVGRLCAGSGGGEGQCSKRRCAVTPVFKVEWCDTVLRWPAYSTDISNRVSILGASRRNSIVEADANGS